MSEHRIEIARTFHAALYGRVSYERPVHIYMLADPTGAATCYVGASFDPWKRLYGHFISRGESKTGKKCDWLRMLWRRGLQPTIIVLDTVSASEAKVVEEDIISLMRALRGANCLNVSSQGYSKRFTTA